MLRYVTPLAIVLITTSLHAGEPQKTKDAERIDVGGNDWPWWRGPSRNGHADPKQTPPLKWSATENVLWKMPIPGRGHGSPIVVADHVYLGTADDKQGTQSVLCFDRQSGKQIWQTIVHSGSVEKGGNAKASFASSTLACDGQRVYATFLHKRAIYATALTTAGKIDWQTKITDYVLHQGFASSPTVYKSLVLVSADNKGAGLLAALERATGKFVWKQERPKLPNYASPIILNTAGREQLLFTGCKLVTSLDPLTGKKLWEVAGSTEECVTSPVTDGKLIITSGGYPKKHVAALKADGSGETVWEIKTQVYVPSMIEHNGYLYAVQDNGIAMCMKFDNGKEIWKQRLGGSFSASPVLVGDLLFATNESGRTFVYKAKPEGFESIAENQLGDEAMATPTICGGRIYLRVATGAKTARQEMLYCLGK